MPGFHVEAGVAKRVSRSSGRGTCRGGAFSLIELLVVTFIILILVSILTPALRRSVRQAASTVCAHNMRAIDQMMQIYRLENSGWLPHLAEDDPDSSDDQQQAWFDMLLGRYLVDLSVLVCPDDPYRGALEWAAQVNLPNGRANLSSYGMSAFVLGSPGSYLANLDRHPPRRPLDTLILADMGPDSGGGHSAGTSQPFRTPERNECQLPWSDGVGLDDVDLSEPWLTRRHGSSINVLTFGGAVRSVRTTELMNQTIENYYDGCAAGNCTFCLELQVPHYSFAHTRTYWWTGPVPSQ